MSLFADTIAPVLRAQPDQLFLVRIVAIPAPDNPEIDEVSGAYANCWVDTDALRSAEQIALEAITREGWHPQEFKHWNLVTRDIYELDANRTAEERQELAEHFDEAFANGYSLVFHCWPPDAPDARDDT